MTPFQTVVRTNLNPSKQVVYRFQGYDIASDKVITSDRMATQAFIQQMGFVAIGEGFLIDASDLETNSYTAIGFEPSEN